MKRLLLPLALVTAVLLGALAWKLVQRDAEREGPPRSSAVVEGTDADVSSRVGGRLVSLEVAEGDRVEAGAVLARLDCDVPEAALAEAEARLAEARSRVEVQAAQAEGARAQRSAAGQSAQAARAKVAALEARTGLAAREAERVDRLGSYASTSRQDQSTTNAAGLAQELEAAEREAAGLAASARAVSAQADAADRATTSAERALAVAEALVARVRLDVGECVVRSPLGGFVEERFFEVGELVAPGRPVARVVALDPVEVTFYVPNQEVGRVQTGARAEVVADAYPDRVFDGVVTTVSTEAAFTPRNVQTRSDRDRLVFPVEVRVRNPDHALRPGMPVEVTLADGPAVAARPSEAP